MNVPQLIEEVRHQVPDGAPPGTRWKGGATVVTAHSRYRVSAAARIDLQGRRREQFWCDDVRVPLPVLLRLTCSEVECPHAVQVRAQWVAHHGGGQARATQAAPRALPLMAEVPLRVSGQRVTARPARFPCFTHCPNGAHPPLTIHKSGHDLFDASGCLGGGVVHERGVQRPRIPTLQAAEAFAFARQLEGLAAVAAASDSSRDAGGANGSGGDPGRA